MQRCSSTSAEPSKYVWCQIHTKAKQSRRVHTQFACGEVQIFVELRATEPSEDALRLEKIHTAVLLYGEDS